MIPPSFTLILRAKSTYNSARSASKTHAGEHMPFTVEEFRDLVRILEARREWPTLETSKAISQKEICPSSRLQKSGRIWISHLGKAEWRCRRLSTACMAFLPSAMPF